jgi:acyl-CoA reductase-like NAD-dependent aldehyde dehydrogenase
MLSINFDEFDIERMVQSVLKGVEEVMNENKVSLQVAAPAVNELPKTPMIAASQFAVKGKGQQVGQQQSVITPMKMKPTTHHLSNSNGSLLEKDGVFDCINQAIDAGFTAQKQYVKTYQLKDREQIITAIRQAVVKEKEYLAKLVFEETKLGNYQDKIAKHELVALGTPGIEDLNTAAFSGDNGLTIVEQAPFGLIGAVTPVTNPTETIINNSISMLAAGNAVVFNVHPSSKRACAYVVSLINQAIKAVGGPLNLVTMVKDPSLETIKQLSQSPKVKLLVGTGGPGLVSMLLKSGKKAIGAGAGNPPVIVDETADLENAAKSIVLGASFDNNLLCIAEKEVFVLDEVADDLIFQLLNHGGYMLDRNQLENLMSFALERNRTEEARGCSLDSNRAYHVSKDWVGKDANEFLSKLGIQTKTEVKLLICEVGFDHPFVQLEQMMPVLPIVRVKDLDEAIEMAVLAENGNRHTAVMHSRSVDHLTKFAREIETTIFVKNASSLAGVGFGGEGHTTMTIAGPTGEGITSARTFTRQRRCVLAEGGFRIIG